MIGLIGAAVSAVGSIAAGQAAKQEADYNAQVAEINARTARQQGIHEADQIEDKYQKLRGQQRVAAAKSGLDPAVGSPALVINQETARNENLDMMTQIWNRETEAVGDENRATAFRIKGKNAQQAAAFGAAGSFLSGLNKANSGVGNPISIG